MTTKIRIVFTFKSPEMLAPANIPVAAGKKMANTEKKLLLSLNDGPKFSLKSSPTNTGIVMLLNVNNKNNGKKDCYQGPVVQNLTQL